MPLGNRPGARSHFHCCVQASLENNRPGRIPACQQDKADGIAQRRQHLPMQMAIKKSSC